MDQCPPEAPEELAYLLFTMPCVQVVERLSNAKGQSNHIVSCLVVSHIEKI
jgi:hypothetical protein